MLLQDILRTKGSVIHSINSSATLGQVVQKLMQNKCGALVVCDDNRLSGIISERDILRACAERHDSLDNLVVSDYMTRDVITGTPDNSVEHIMGVMTDSRVRHLPVLEDDKLVGIISIGDVVKAQHHQALVENHYLKSYIQG